MHLKRLGPYELGKVIGKGGMGSVYEAIDSQSGQRVAVKALNPQLAAAEGFRERFEAEIDSLKTLRHEGVVRLYGYGEQDGVLFYSMELVEGTSLEEELRQGRRFNWREVADIAIQLCRALKHAHDHGVVHRDIKPANILIDANDRVKLADFGIARLFGSTQLTAAGGVLGTADYMSPEQADGRPVTDRCDQYSLGGVMYALLAGRTPFRARTLPEMIQLQRFADPEPVRRYAPDTPQQMELLIKQLLSKDPQNRFPNTLVLARHLEAMVRALSRPEADSSQIRVLVPPPDDYLGRYADELAATRAEDDLEQLGMAAGVRSFTTNLGQDPAHVAPLGESALADAPTPPAPATAVEIAAPPRRTVERTTFTSVAEEADRARAAQQKARRLVAVQAAGVGILLLALVALVYYLSQPKNEDALYQAIRHATDSDEEARVRRIDRHINEFLNRFPDDPRAEEVADLRRQLELDRLERRLQLRARQPGRLDDSLLPIERHYIEGIRMAERDLERGVEALAAMTALFDPALFDEHETAPSAGGGAANREAHERHNLCYELALRQLDQLRTELERRVSEQLPALYRRIEVADELATTDTHGARRIYQAIIDLYGDRQWAADVVADAQQRLKRLNHAD